MTQQYDRANSLKIMAENKSINTLAKVKNALTEMQQNNVAISFQSVATYAGVSKTWLYSNDEISRQIRGHRGNHERIKKLLDSNTQIDSKNKQIDILQKRVATMTSEIEALKCQLEAAYAELYKR